MCCCTCSGGMRACQKWDDTCLLFWSIHGVVAAAACTACLLSQGMHCNLVPCCVLHLRVHFGCGLLRWLSSTSHTKLLYRATVYTSVGQLVEPLSTAAAGVVVLVGGVLDARVLASHADPSFRVVGHLLFVL